MVTRYENARALLLACALSKAGEPQLSTKQTAQFAAFVQHAWNSDTRRFRNFMSYDRRWLEPQGSEDSHGRTLWALGECASGQSDPALKKWAATLFETALPEVQAFSSPRAWAFTLLGLDAYCKSTLQAPVAERIRRHLAHRLMTSFAAHASDDWAWFEDGLAYDNARLFQALIQNGGSTEETSYTNVGLRSLRWLMKLQTAPSGCFRPVGSHSLANFVNHRTHLINRASRPQHRFRPVSQRIGSIPMARGKARHGGHFVGSSATTICESR